MQRSDWCTSQNIWLPKERQVVGNTGATSQKRQPESQSLATDGVPIRKRFEDKKSVFYSGLERLFRSKPEPVAPVLPGGTTQNVSERL